MTTTVCAYAHCGDRRVHYEAPDTPRGPQPTDGYRYCSITCAVLDGAIQLRGSDAHDG